ncbi:hypothetical protein P691DRAFT_775685 [Macrolepiota fuliginosa MF-IS2]|uniref:Uncharacterized protein n=1 Tax=Macrolepiota fuliginosa MF-IS2 TaxID=1400762 RepID=A0A9P6C157_9AGAR|nr:hypothetical protein P691DRAFT_775685 [Macrolepiota fuliginosa MF-IS2]
MSKEPTKPTLQKIQTVDDDEFDELDDFLDKFPKTKPVPSAPPPSATITSTPPTIGNRPRHNTRVDSAPISIPGTGPRLAATTEEDLNEDELSAEFARELAKGMESLMKEITNNGSTSTAKEGTNSSTDELTDEEKAQAFKAAWEAMLVEGLSGMDADGLGEPLDNDGVKPKDAGTSAPPNDFQSKIKQAMGKLKESESNLQSGSGGGGAGAAPESLEDLMKSLNDLGLGEGSEGDAELAGFLENMMGQLMSKDVLYEPLKELADNFPGYLSNPPKPFEPAEKTRYEKQFAYVKQIIEVFERPNYSDSDPEANKTIMSLMGEMQSFGSPPAEIMGPLPPGFENSMSAADGGECAIA